MTLHFTFICLGLLTVGLSATVFGTTIEIYDGNYYGIEDDQGVTQIRVSGPSLVSTVSSTSQDGVVIRPLPADANPDDMVGGHGRHHRGRHHHRGGHHRHHHHHPVSSEDADASPFQVRHEWWGNLTEEQKLTHICAKIQSDSQASSDVTRRRGRHHGGGMMSWKLQMLPEEYRQRVIEMWGRRKQDMLSCCSKDSVEEKLQCVGEMNTARYQRVCLGEEPLCPWAQYMPTNNRSATGRRSYHHHHHYQSDSVQPASNTTATCCQLQDMDRVKCFTDARNLYRQQFFQNMHGSGMRGRLEGSRRMRPDDSTDSRVSSRRQSSRPRAARD